MKPINQQAPPEPTADTEPPPPAHGPDLLLDPERLQLRPITNIHVRAKHPETGAWTRCDIKHLDRRSLLRWLSEDPERTRRLVLVLLEHRLDGMEGGAA